jgi:hypothetical protein
MFLITLVLDDHVSRVPAKDPLEHMAADESWIDSISEKEESILNIVKANLDSVFL